uniref:Uncharacterized protein n=1 Tax=Opuntia streptacantha TaxID=393608 RepID=A0A7C8Z114_OPUST
MVQHDQHPLVTASVGEECRKYLEPYLFLIIDVFFEYCLYDRYVSLNLKPVLFSTRTCRSLEIHLFLSLNNILLLLISFLLQCLFNIISRTAYLFLIINVFFEFCLYDQYFSLNLKPVLFSTRT